MQYQIYPRPDGIVRIVLTDGDESVAMEMPMVEARQFFRDGMLAVGPERESLIGRWLRRAAIRRAVLQ